MTPAMRKTLCFGCVHGGKGNRIQRLRRRGVERQGFFFMAQQHSRRLATLIVVRLPLLKQIPRRAQRFVNMRSRLLRIVSVIAALILFTTVIAASTKCHTSNFACFKRKMMPKMGHKITVVGVLASAKLHSIVRFDNWGVYIYAVQDSATSKINPLDSFNGQTIEATGILRYSPGSPTTRTDVASVPEHFFFDVAAVKVISNRPIAEMTFREMRWRKPPLVELYFDVVLHNDRTEPLWVLLPSNLGPESASVGTKGGVDGVEVIAPHGEGRVVIGHFLGTGGFQALLLPAHAEVRLRMFPISYWGEPPDQLNIEVVTAKRLTIGGEEARTWFKVNPTSSVKADVAEIATSSMRMVRSRHTPDRKEVASLIEEDKRFEVKVPLGRK